MSWEGNKAHLSKGKALETSLGGRIVPCSMLRKPWKAREGR